MNTGNTTNKRRKFLLATGALIPMGLIGCGGGSAPSSAPASAAAPPPPAPASGSQAGSRALAKSSPASTMTLGPAIVVDQFGYLPAHDKIAVVRNPQTGFDAADSFAPGAVYEVVNAVTNVVVFSGTPVAWNGGATDATSGDQAWHVDFSTVTAPGQYFIRDTQRNVTSPAFRIAADVYKPVLRAAVRYFYYQRAGIAKTAALAGAGWADAASHLGPLQDKQARLFSAPGDSSTERDVSGGWYDAGDYNKYTRWHAGYLIDLLHAFADNPGIWGKDYNIPESGNQHPDLLDEIKWGMDWLIKMQEASGAMLSIAGLAHASPPSAATGRTLYGPPNTSATLAAAGAFALGAKVFGARAGLSSYGAGLKARAERAWNWAVANPDVLFKNNDAAYNSVGLGAGQQETDDYGRLGHKLAAAIYLYQLTGKAVYNNFVNAQYLNAHLFVWYNYASPFEGALQQALLHYASLSNATPATASAIRTAFATGMNGTDHWTAMSGKTDPYLAHLQVYTWGSNAIKSQEGAMFAALAHYGLGTRPAAANMNAASHYIHYLHGVNPLGKVYLSNMGTLGAENSVDQFYHTWFAHGSAKWDSVKESTFGPPPGFLVGGPNPSYNWENGCPGLHPGCGTAVPAPPFGQPPQKSYLDFNDSWPLNSWSVTENANGYQSAYIRLLSRFVS
ncbi:glycoside hydrolase family 9 protein [Massilia violaceinigra]|nr:glycoside hydrolase family 9 protein [Massilia violaceinigra]